MLFPFFNYMKRFYFLLILTSIISCSVHSQNMYSDSGGGGVLYLKPMSPDSPAYAKRGSFVGPHLLGDSVTSLLNTFEKSYVYYKSSSGAYPVEEMVVLKKSIYKKIHEFDNFISKSYTHKLISKEEAAKRLMKVTNIGIKLMSFDTRQLEKEVKRLNVPTDFERYLGELKFR